MNEFFGIAVDGHLDQLESIATDLRRIDSYHLDSVDLSRIEGAKRQLKAEIESFRQMAETARTVYPTFREAS
jgi:hypothetical protein